MSTNVGGWVGDWLTIGRVHVEIVFIFIFNLHLLQNRSTVLINLPMWRIIMMTIDICMIISLFWLLTCKKKNHNY